MAFAKSEDLPLDRLIDTLGKGAGSSWYFVNRAPNILRDSYPAGFRVKLHEKKDLKICRAMAARHGVQLPLIEMTLVHYRRLIEQGHGDEDISTLFRLRTRCSPRPGIATAETQTLISLQPWRRPPLTFATRRHRPRRQGADVLPARFLRLAGASSLVVLIAELVALVIALARQALHDSFWTDLAGGSMFLLWIGLTCSAVLCRSRSVAANDAAGARGPDCRSACWWSRSASCPKPPFRWAACWVAT